MIKFPSWVFRGLYRLLDKLDKDKQLVFMNYGYTEPGKMLDLEGDDEINRYCIQLYHHIAEMVDLNDKKIVEVGSGRGGGLAYVSRNFHPLSSTGVDIEKSAVAFSNRMFGNERLQYIVGNAEKLPLADEFCDIVMNVESSHRYLSMNSFVGEVHRVLKPEGYFLFTDFRYAHQWTEVKRLLEDSRFEVMRETDITDNVIDALEKDSYRREKLVKSYAPIVLRNGILNFTGAKGTATYEHFLGRKFVYRSFLLQKDGAK
jgi:ubiquinone/menaquinone biosynthesis C-methylase UbiE